MIADFRLAEMLVGLPNRLGFQPFLRFETAFKRRPLSAVIPIEIKRFG
jgi:hypothetical protein